MKFTESVTEQVWPQYLVTTSFLLNNIFNSENQRELVKFLPKL